MQHKGKKGLGALALALALALRSTRFLAAMPLDLQARTELQSSQLRCDSQPGCLVDFSYATSAPNSVDRAGTHYSTEQQGIA